LPFPNNPDVPVNSPAISDLFDLFGFGPFGEFYFCRPPVALGKAAAGLYGLAAPTADGRTGNKAQ
jgi:hypothetical protein